MQFTSQQLAAALDAISECIGKADQCVPGIEHGDEFSEGAAAWQIEQAYLRLAIVCEVVGLEQLRRDIVEGLAAGKRQGMDRLLSSPDGDPYLASLSDARRVHAALQGVLAIDASTTITKDLVSILRELTYTITDKAVFNSAPESESDVHRRAEAVLRCVFPDLIHKPRLSKSAKRF